MGGKGGGGGNTVDVVLDRATAENLFYALAIALGVNGGKKGKKGKKGKGGKSKGGTTKAGRKR